ncbi:MAG: type II toxin-antitoxin system HicB family antitoxin [Armatimonadota bacterium]|jgi:predicted RNase H-like HicB family nuclease
MNYLVVYEPTSTGWSAYVPDLPGWVATARTREEAQEQTREAIDFHIEGLRETRRPVPPASSVAEVVDVGGD